MHIDSSKVINNIAYTTSSIKQVNMTSRKTSKRKHTSRNLSKLPKGSRTGNDSAPNAAPFRFLDLPPELRSNVYRQVTEESTRVISRIKIHDPASMSALSCLNRQVRSEFLSLTLDLTPSLETEVRNWDFSHVIGFLNRIGDEKLQILSSSCGVVVKLWFSGENADPSGLMRWLDRFGMEKRGSGVKFEYTRKSLAYVQQNWRVAGFRACTVGGPRGREEFRSIEEALLSIDPTSSTA